jgi:transcriptional regulator with XRE-family HTH domain
MKREILVRLRLQQGLSQEGLARKAGLSMMTVFNVENGGFPRPKNIPILAKSYEIAVEEFVKILYKEDKDDSNSIKS